MALVTAAAVQAVAGQRVRVAVFNNPPLMTYDADEGRVGGIFIDVLRHTADREGWEVEYVPGEPWQGVERLWAGEADLVPGVPHSRAREEQLSFTRETLATSWVRIYVRSGSKIRTVQDLAGKKVAVLKGSLMQSQVLHRSGGSGPPPDMIEYTDFGQAFRAVAAGEAEAVLCNRFTGAHYARKTGLHPTPVVLAPYGFRFVTRPDARMERLLDGLDRNLLLLKTDPDSIYYKDLQELEDGAREDLVPRWVYWGAAASVVLVLIALGWALAMRRTASRISRAKSELRMAHDVVQRTMGELHRINDNSLDVIAVFDASFNVLRVNRACEKLLGRPPEDLIGRSALDWVPPQCRPSSRSVLEQVRCGASLQGHASQILHADGTVIPVLWSLAWSEEVHELYAIGHDDTARSQLIFNLKRRTEQLQVVNRDLQTFAQSVSHDLRAPLAAVVGFVGKVLLDEGDTLQERSRELLTRAHAASQRMDGIVVNLLRLTRVTERGVQRRECDVTAMCQDVITALRHEHPGRDVSVEIQAGMRAFADMELLRHVFDNLISNAWKFTSHKSRAHLTVGCEDDPMGRVFFVRDDGAGFDMEYANNLFVPFGRLHSDKEFVGIGIGLCVAHRVVTAHSGRIWAQGSPGGGAVFSFTLGEPATLADCALIAREDGLLVS